MRPRPDGRQRRIGAGIDAENVADGIFMNGHAELFHLPLHIIASAYFRLCEEHTSRAEFRCRIVGIDCLQPRFDVS